MRGGFFFSMLKRDGRECFFFFMLKRDERGFLFLQVHKGGGLGLV
jgi:hypothetical protein